MVMVLMTEGHGGGKVMVLIELGGRVMVLMIA